MQIFVLDKDPQKAAEMMCDKHIPKMVLESAQILCSVAHIYKISYVPYRLTHRNHPCIKWTEKSKQNFLWLYEHGMAIANEYELRFGKVHKSKAIIEWSKFVADYMPDIGLTDFAMAFDDKYKSSDVVKSYHNYYRTKEFAKWEKGRNPPEWW